MRGRDIAIALALAAGCTGHGEAPLEPGEDAPPPSPIAVVPTAEPPAARDEAAAADDELDQRSAREHFTEGVQAYERGDYEAALEHFVAADALVPSPQIRFNIAHTHEQLGDAAAARAAYQALLDEPELDPQVREVVQARLRTLEAAER